MTGYAPRGGRPQRPTQPSPTGMRPPAPAPLRTATPPERHLTQALVGAAVYGLLAALVVGTFGLLFGRTMDPLSAGALVAAGYLLGSAE